MTLILRAIGSLPARSHSATSPVLGRYHSDGKPRLRLKASGAREGLTFRDHESEAQMNTMQSPTPESFAASLRVKPAVEAPVARPANLKNNRPPDRGSWPGQLAPLVRYPIAFFIGVTTVLAWQSYGDAAREKIAPTAPSPYQQQFAAMSLDLDAVRQGVDQIATGLATSQEQMRRIVDQLAASHEWMTRDFSGKLEAIEHNILDKIPVPPPRPAPGPPRNLVQRPAQVPMAHSGIP
jgi:hypothetical protein